MENILEGLHRATLAIARRETLDEVLQQIVSAAKGLLNAEYSALGVPNDLGLLDEFIHVGMPVETANQMDHLPRGKGLLGAIIKEKRPIRVANIAQDSRSIGFPAHHPPMRSFLGVPIIGENEEVLGNLYFCNKLNAYQFSAEDEMLAQMFAANAAIAIHNARLDEDVQRLAVLEERSRIGMDLHDGIIQSIYAVGLTLESASLANDESKASATEKEDVRQLLDEAIVGLNDAIRDIRNFILDLRPQRYEGDLMQAIGRLAREFQANTMCEIEVIYPDETLQNLPPKVGRTLFLSIQNSLANIARHAKASEVWLNIEKTADLISMEIRDNGIGFDPLTQRDSVGHGLHNMRTRADNLNGTFSLKTAPGAGTIIKIELPLTRHNL